ncbi:MAG: DUF1553 domain-containing protein [Planctomycetia bacterium]|nr:DUF1553 domain-containing protein [Planctomycetia bacterium]
MMRTTLGLLILVLAAHPGRADEADVLYSRHVQAVFSRLGCNGGTCHGAVQGQNGFKLSLFGADAAKDYAHLLQGDGGRRLNLHDPAQSLLLLKATGQVAHQGGKRTDVGSPEYELLRRWLAAGAPQDALAASEVRSLTVAPAEQVIKPDASYRLRVEAHFADGSRADVTALCSYEALDPSVATVNASGVVEARGVGAAALLVRYRAVPALAQVLAPRPGDEPFPEVQPENFIDRHVLARLRQLNIPPSAPANDATFLRRACLDVTGELPTSSEVRAFLTDADPHKRVKKIDELLARPGHAALWTLKFCDLLKASDWGEFGVHIATEHDAPRFQAWVRARLEENLPYDQFVERILTATSREGRSLEAYAQEAIAVQEGYGPNRTDLDIYQARRTLDLYWQRNHAHGVNAAQQVAHAFLGLRLECAQCHRHPADVWQQDDLLSFANFFVRVRPVGSKNDNAKRFPEHAALGKIFEAEAKKLGEEIKQLRDGALKQAEAAFKDAKNDPAAKQRLDEVRGQVSALERRSKALPGVASRLLHHEVHLLTKDVPLASVTSPLGTQTSKQFRLPGEKQALEVPADQDPRTVVMAWLRRPDNPYFAKAIVNRVWAHYFGRGIVDPPDNLSPFNPATHPELLQALAQGFVASGYDLRWLHRTILHSGTYQRSSTATPANELDRANYATFYFRRLPAEVLIDLLNQTTGTTEKMGMERYHWPAHLKAIELPMPPKGAAGGDAPTNAFVHFMLESFGKPARNAAVQCDCERDPSATMLQVLSLANHPRVWEKIADPQGRAARIAKDTSDNRQRIEELYLTTLSRYPTDAERRACEQYLKGASSPVQGVQGVLWGLINTREFLLNH